MGFVQTSKLIPASVGDVYRHITDLTHFPSWVSGHFEVDLPGEIPVLREAVQVELAFKRFGIRRNGLFRVDELVPRERVVYRQLQGVFKTWVHTQVLVKHGPKTTLLSDHVEYELHYGILGAIADDVFVRRDVETILNDRLLRIAAFFRDSSAGSDE